jgi:periplasmic protein TonB
VLFAPANLLTKPAEAPRTVMTISLGGGAAGPRNGGLTTLGGRPVQQQIPPDAPKKPEAVRPPAAKTPEMTVPTRAKPTKATPPAPQIKQAPEDARGRTPTRGAEVSEGSAVAATGARGQGFGLSTGGGGGSGSSLDVANFCCPDYLITMTERIRSNWNARQEVGGNVVIRFTIQRDGTLTDIQVEKGAGYPALDLSAQRAVYVTKQLPALPAPFPNPTLTVHLNFNYQR